MLQVDSSKDGLGAAILQGGRPTEFASRALTQAELKWAQIGKETLFRPVYIRTEGAYPE